ncbi:hypothetical protein AYO21_09524 [Fonsecaea monophora]|uniref:Uncharacterized protein n=1 Tax=Fonsecaea monophora TaxID=254056 RepID=A0A177EZ12_9EURO|nr:hypothetical protein AYO21_09524 [Fonsecaea monophora]OAG36282.1 hypothetical protein AYO21_09524 [Fonsecaea monophora]
MATLRPAPLKRTPDTLFAYNSCFCLDNVENRDGWALRPGDLCFFFGNMIVQIENDGEEYEYSEPLVDEEHTRGFVGDIFHDDPAAKFYVDRFMDKWKMWEKRRSKAEASHQSTKKDDDASTPSKTDDASTLCEGKNDASNDTDQQKPRPFFRHRSFFCPDHVDERHRWELYPGDLGFFLDGIVAIKADGEEIVATTDKERYDLLDKKCYGEEVVIFLVCRTWKRRCDDFNASQ